MAICKDQGLVRRGPYGLIRHPIYTGVLVAIIGSALTPASPVTLIGLANASIFVFWRIREEDKLLKTRFGTAFDDYRRTVSALIPAFHQEAA